MGFKAPSRRILVIKTRSIGDTVMLTGVLRLLRQNNAHFNIDVLTRHPGGHLLEALPYVNRVICISEPKNSYLRFLYWIRLVRRLRVRRYDMVLNFHASIRTAFFARLLRTRMVVANHHDLKSRNWFSDVDVPNRGQVKSIIDRDLDVLRALGMNVDPGNAMPEIVLESAEKHWARAKLQSIHHKGPLIFLGIGGSRETKRWPPRHYSELAKKLSRDFNAKFVITAVKEDHAWLETFNNLLQEESALDPKSALHITTLKELNLRRVAAIISMCGLYVGNDSGLKHVAIALGLSSYTFFGPELPLEWHPYDVKKHPYAFIKELDCRTESGQHWCSIAKCEKHGHQCMQDITPESVYGDISVLLKRAHAGAPL